MKPLAAIILLTIVSAAWSMIVTKDGSVILSPLEAQTLAAKIKAANAELEQLREALAEAMKHRCTNI